MDEGRRPDDADRPPTRRPGALRVARVLGIDVHVHWSWVIAIVVLAMLGREQYSNLAWSAASWIGLFVIVLLHEFGHALACRSVGGRADDVLLWPLGGVTFVMPPYRPGALLWSVAAGPLVNLVLAPVLVIAAYASGALGVYTSRDGGQPTNLQSFWFSLAVLNLVVFVFNVLPIYPLDGGKMLHALLWFFLGPHRSLVIAAGLGVVGALGGIVLAFASRDWWLGLVAWFAVTNAWRATRLARARLQALRGMRRAGLSCPQCHEAPPAIAAWPCTSCGTIRDVFADQGVCRACGNRDGAAFCVFCGKSYALAEFGAAPLTWEPVTVPEATVTDAPPDPPRP